jgi:hypothetical protein
MLVSDYTAKRTRVKKKINIIKRVLKHFSQPKKMAGGFARAALTTATIDFIKNSGDENPRVFELFRYLYKKYSQFDWVGYDTHAFLADDYESKNIDKILALKLLLKTDAYFNIPYAFESVTLALNDAPVIPDTPQNIFPDQIAYSVMIANIFRDQDMSESVEAYIISQMIDSGYSVLLFPMDIEGSFVPKEMTDVTKEVEAFIEDETGKIELSDAGKEQLDMYYDLLDILHDKLKMEVEDVS